MPKPVLAAVNGPAVGIGCSLALACDLVLAAESAYFLLAFVNIGLVPDGGSSVLRPRARRRGRARPRWRMLGERDPGARRRAPGGSSTGWSSDDAFDAEVDALAEQLATGPTRVLRGRQGAAQRAGLRGARRAARAGGVAAGADGRRRRTSSEGVSGLPGEARRAGSPATELSRPDQSIHCAAAMDPLPPPRSCSLRRALAAGAAGASASTRRPGRRGAALPRGRRRLAERRGHPDALHDHLRASRIIVFVGVEGVLIWCLVKYRAKQGPRRRPDPRQHAAGDRLDRRRRRDPRLPDDRDVRDAARDQEPGGVRHRRERQPGRLQRRLRLDRPAARRRAASR